MGQCEKRKCWDVVERGEWGCERAIAFLPRCWSDPSDGVGLPNRFVLCSGEIEEIYCGASTVENHRMVLGIWAAGTGVG